MPDTINEQWHDPIVAEIRQVREDLFAEAGQDLREFCRRLREQQDQSGHQVVSNASGTESRKPDDAA